MKNFILTIALIITSSAASAQSTGTLQVNGQLSKVQLFQKAKAIRCESPGKCDAAVIFDLNKPQALPAGTYIVGYEGTIFPELVELSSGGSRVLNLQTINVPPSVKGQKIRVYRDLTDRVEQGKTMMTFFQLKQHFFRLENERFGDLYLTGTWDRDFVRRFDYSICAKIKDYRKANSAVPDLALEVCKAWNSATSPQELAPLFVFLSDGSMEQRWVSYPGDLFIVKFPRHLISIPVTDADTVSVFPGVYKFQSEDSQIPAEVIRAGI